MIGHTRFLPFFPNINIFFVNWMCLKCMATTTLHSSSVSFYIGFLTTFKAHVNNSSNAVSHEFLHGTARISPWRWRQVGWVKSVISHNRWPSSLWAVLNAPAGIASYRNQRSRAEHSGILHKYATGRRLKFLKLEDIRRQELTAKPQGEKTKAVWLEFFRTPIPHSLTPEELSFNRAEATLTW